MVYYFSTKKQRNIGNLMFIISIFIVSFSFIVTTSVNPEVHKGIHINER
ncbi:MAG: hypothetical protein DSZ21_02670 [Tenericutes bacterium]|nr:MAG: hypothetical protein DSZ21_02670 [Mycoplasmatota bacterium]